MENKKMGKNEIVLIFLRALAEFISLLLDMFFLEKITGWFSAILVCLIVYIILAIIPHLIVKTKHYVIVNILSVVLYSIISFIACMVYVSGVGETAGALIVVLIIANLLIMPAYFIINLVIDIIFKAIRNDSGTIMYCKNCGNQLNKNAMFCGKCGIKTNITNKN